MLAKYLARFNIGGKTKLDIYKKGHIHYLDCQFLAIDLELTSLDGATADMISIGFVPLHGGKIISSLARHILIRDHGGVGQSATIHGLRDCDTETGVPLIEAMTVLNQALKNHIPVFHHAALDLAVLSRFDSSFKHQVAVDTLKLEQKKLSQQGQRLENALRLDQCRARYNLPRYQAHNALSDALATAELFLAHVAHKSADAKVRVRELL